MRTSIFICSKSLIIWAYLRCSEVHDGIVSVRKPIRTVLADIDIDYHGRDTDAIVAFPLTMEQAIGSEDSEASLLYYPTTVLLHVLLARRRFNWQYEWNRWLKLRVLWTHVAIDLRTESFQVRVGRLQLQRIAKWRDRPEIACNVRRVEVLERLIQAYPNCL